MFLGRFGRLGCGCISARIFPSRTAWTVTWIPPIKDARKIARGVDGKTNEAHGHLTRYTLSGHPKRIPRAEIVRAFIYNHGLNSWAAFYTGGKYHWHKGILSKKYHGNRSLSKPNCSDPSNHIYMGIEACPSQTARIRPIIFTWE